jgi:transposase
MFGTELRSRAIQMAFEEKRKKKYIADALGVDRRTIYNWLKVYKTEGRKEPIRTRTGPGKRRKLDPEEFRKFVDKNSGLSIKQMTIILGVGKSAVATALRTIGYTRKKTIFIPRTERRRATKICKNTIRNSCQKSCLLR